MTTKDQSFQKLEAILGYTFKDVKLLRESLTHKSFANEKPQERLRHNERLEFLGDAVLELVVSDILMTRFPTRAEGELSRIRASVVNESQLAVLAVTLQLGPMILLGKGEEMTKGRKKSSILSNTYEAVIAAIYLDGGFQTVYGVVKGHILKMIDSAAQPEFNRDFKTRLQETIQKRYKKIPQYKVTQSTGPDHNKTFEVAVVLHEEIFTLGTGKSKKEAEQDAARNALKLIKEEEKF